MFQHYIKIALRNFLNDKIQFLIKTLGLALSMFCAMLILLWINDERSYEAFWPDSDRLYRLVQHAQFENGTVFKAASNPGVMPGYLKDNYAGIEEFTRFRPSVDKVLMEYKNTKFYEDVTYVDSTFFKVFRLPFLVGNRENALKDPNSMVITVRIAEKYFGTNWHQETVLGKLISLNKDEHFSVSGVIENLPSNTHFKFDILLPFSKLVEYGWYMDWDNNSYYAYFLLKKNTDAQALSAQIEQFAKSREDIADIFYLQPLSRIHLYSEFDIDVYGSTEIRYPYVNIFIVVAIAIVLIAGINFMNLATAQSEKRSKEIGLRKTIGSRRIQIIFQLLSESVLIALFAFLIAVAATILVLPYFNDIVDKSITFGIEKWSIWLSFIACAVFFGLLAGSYPAFFLSGFEPVQVIKGGARIQGSGTIFRRVLVVVQFAVTVILILGTTIVYKQFQYFMDKDLGYDKDLLVYMPVRGEIVDNFNGFKNDLIQQPFIKGVTVSSDIPTYTVHATVDFDWDGKNEEENILFHIFSVDFDFIETLGLQIVEGRNFSLDFPADSANYILNEEALRLTGIESPIGSRFKQWGNEGTIIGIIKDFHFKSLHQKVEPLVLRIIPAQNEFIMANVTPGNTSRALSIIEEVWGKYNTGYPFEYHFLNENYESLYNAEKRMSQIFDYFTFLTFFIACMGLIGLINHMIAKKRKEITIRKVFGATIAGVLLYFSKEYVLLILFAFAISIPIASYFITGWLENFAYQIEIHWWIYLIPGALVLLITLLLICAQTLKVARQNPVNYLRYE